MTDKCTDPAAAAREIDRQYTDPSIDFSSPEHRLATVEAIIKKHCLQDKAVGKLVEALKAALPILEDAYGGQQPPPRYEIKLAKAALADYEANK